MGVLNLTPDSFYDGDSKILQDKSHLELKFKKLIEADIIDVGCESSRPGSVPVSQEEEIERLSCMIDLLKQKKNVLSIDTYKHNVAEYALKHGFSMINDIYAASYEDNKMFEIAAKYNVPIILMHMKGTPLDMQKKIHYNSLIDDILFFFEERIKVADTYGISSDNIILDPGIGFGKSYEDNFKIIKNIDKFKRLGHKVLIGLSRKSFLNQNAGSPKGRLSATIAMNTISAINGADILRVHDIKECVETIAVLEKYFNSYKN